MPAVRPHGGSLRAESEEGQFTEFTITPPAQDRPRGAD
jgi:signal transduction histidine kinase